MNCATCDPYRPIPREPIQPGLRVRLPYWQQALLRRTMQGTVEWVGHPGTRRAGTAKIRWDSGRADWWPVTMLIPLREGEAEA